jgi:glycosidase
MLSYIRSLFTILCTILFLSHLTNQNVVGQVVTFEPSFATQNDSLTVYFDATEGNGALEGFTGRVFLHTGVITSLSKSGSDWKYVPAGWESYPSNLEAKQVAQNLWKFTFGPNIREFFGISNTSEQVVEVAMLFKGTRSLSGAPIAIGRDVGGKDIFIELSSGGVEARFVLPIAPLNLIQQADSLMILGIGSSTTGNLNLSLYQDETLISQTERDSIVYTFIPDSDSEQVQFQLIASDGQGVSDTASTTVVIRPNELPQQPRPEKTPDGINYTSDTSVRLSLFAPNKDYVYVVGDFNDWTPTNEFLMNKDTHNSDSTWFWIDIEGLVPGKEYGFQYLVDGILRVADPYSELVLHPDDDPYVPANVYPNLLEYPYGKTSFSVGVLRPGASDYEWKTTNYERPGSDDLVIYELLLRDFLETSSYQTLIDTLDYLERLGINAIELMPVNEFEGNLSWGYNPSFHLALDKYYGTKDSFKAFVDAAHSRGIAVILDVVLNHAYGRSPLIRLWNEGDYGAPTSQNPYANQLPKHPFNVGYDLNHESAATRYFSKRVMEYWLNEYRVDGFRFDLSKGFTQVDNLNDVGAWGAYDASRIAIWKDYYDYIRSVDSSAYVILEHFGDNYEERVLVDIGMMIWGNMNHDYSEATMGYNSDLRGTLASHRNFSSRKLVSYMESHDEQWLMFKNIAFGNSSGDYSIRDWSTAYERMKLAGAFFFTLPGPKMMWQFGELGYGYGNAGEQCLNDQSYCPSTAPSRTANKPIRWDYREDPDRYGIYETWSNLIRLRKASKAFTHPDSFSHELQTTVKFIRLSYEDTKVVIVGNFGVNSITGNVAFPEDGVWYNYLSKTEINVQNGNQEMVLGPGDYFIFTNKDFSALVTTNEPESEVIPKEFGLLPSYPNPFNPSTQITFNLEQAGRVQLGVYDLLGREVRVLVQEALQAGVHEYRFDASSLSSGTYIVRLIHEGKVSTQKITLIK